MKTGICRINLLAGILCLALLGTPVATAMDIDGLGSGSLGLQTKQLEDGRFVIALMIDVDDVVAASVVNPDDDIALIHVVLEDEKDLVEEALGVREAYTSTSVSGDTLSGRMEHALAYDASGIRALEVTLVTRSGEVHPVRVQSRGFATGEKHEIELRGTRCYTIRFSCVKPNGDSCSTTKECCSQRVDYCTDCNGCEVTCPPCSLLP